MIPASVTTLKPNVRIRRERRLPQAGEITVSVGQEVNPVQVVARASQQRGFTIVPGAELLGVPPQDIHDYLLVEEGAAVQRKKPLLERRSFLGSKTVTSPVNGVLYQVSKGRLILQQTPEMFELRAMLNGIVTGFLGNRGVTIDTQGTLIEAQWATAREGYGIIKVVGERDTPLAPEHIGAGARGSILVCGRLSQASILDLAEENSVRGVIVGSVPGEFVPQLSNYRFPIFLTEGFGALSMSIPMFKMLQQREGLEATLLGMTDNNWRRPEIIIPLSGEERAEPLSGEPYHLRIGQQVRIWREPYAGKTGKVVYIHKRSKVTGSGLRLPGADITLDDGRVVFVPYANLDMIR